MSDELIDRALAVIPELQRTTEMLKGVRESMTSREARELAAELRRAAERVEDAADALELWAEYARLREERVRCKAE
ncbi:MAG: hypothetical protein QME70_09530 [Bacillota bacterium]|nr:hypothetical protein [Bacillota bacterium]